MADYKTVSSEARIFRYCLHQGLQIALSAKSIWIAGIVIAFTFYTDMELTRKFGQANSWDVILYGILNHSVIQLFLFLPVYLLYVYSICHDGPIRPSLLIRLRTKRSWIWSKVIMIFVSGLVFTVLYVGTITLIAFLLKGYDPSWSQAVLEDDTNFLYAQYLSPVEAWLLTSCKHVVSTWVVGSIYLALYTGMGRTRHTVAMLIVMITLLANYMFHMSVFMTYLPYLYLNSEYIRYFTESSELFPFAWNYHLGNVCMIGIALFIIVVREKSLKLGE
ncbi:hypothetical protein [Paenibacillus sp. YYML68]|uniref:hypothetical protein n=1 Tax=Paenibacillus sp. YYML68 TaxID=2909250 RepID=UPI0024923BBA|nr:hypothetical protein [Paenibacillus sp. YYML68]